MKELHELGAGKLYLHLDGWAEPGYDNKHPDYTPACEEAGGWKDMKELADTMQKQETCSASMTSTVIIISQQKALMKIMHADLQTEPYRHIRDGLAGSSLTCAQRRHHIM